MAEQYEILLVRDGLVLGSIIHIRNNDVFGDAFYGYGLVAPFFEYNGRRALDLHGWTDEQVERWKGRRFDLTVSHFHRYESKCPEDPLNSDRNFFRDG